MGKVYVIGHRNPDTDSIVSAMAYAALRNALGDREFIPARLGGVNDETKMVLERFGFEPPIRLDNVRTQVRDLHYDTPPAIGMGATVNYAWSILQGNQKIMALPVVDEEGKLFGMLTAGDIAAYDMRSISDTRVEGLPLFNLLSSLEGQLMYDAPGVDRLSGEVYIALPQTPAPIEEAGKNSILICGEQPDVIEAAIQKQIACLIVCAAQVPNHLIAAAEESGRTCIISTPHDAYRAARLLYQSIPVSRVCAREELVQFHLNDYVDDVREIMLQSRYRSYPVLDEKGMVAGTISRYHLIRPDRKKVVLVDHNEAAQSVSGLDQAEILEIIDHHRLADVQTGNPIYFRNEPVGSTATIIASMFQEKGIMPSESMAGLLASAIVSDTIIFKSPTCTERDKRIAERMARIAKLSLSQLGQEIFANHSAQDRSAKEMLLSDFKEFHIAGHSFGIGQIICLDSKLVMQRQQEFLAAMEAEKEKRGYDLVLLMLTDVLREGTELLMLGDQDIVEQAFRVDVTGNSVFLPKVISRKKQIVPTLSLMWG